jgi:pimeloyl-ACP methyl ester carboxylesterase
MIAGAPMTRTSASRPALLLLPLLLLAVLLVPSPGLGADRGAKNRVPVYTSRPESAKIVFEDVSISTSDGLSLHGWFLPYQDQEGHGFQDERPIVLLLTDGTHNMGELLWHYVNFLRGAPWHVLMFDWRGTGTSSPWASDTTLVVFPEQLIDLRAAIDFAKTRPEFDGKHLGIFAHSAGTAVALAVAAEREDLKAIALRGVFTTQAELCASRGAQNKGSRFRPHPGWPADLEPIRVAQRVKTPTLIVVGEEDKITPPAMAQAVHEALGGPKQYWAAPKSGHEGFDSPEAIHLSPFRVKLHGIFGRYLGKGK